MTNQRKTAFISGAGRNIGRAIALSLARDGFNVVVNGSTFGAACEETAAQARAHGVDAKVAMADWSARVRELGEEEITEFRDIALIDNESWRNGSRSFGRWQRRGSTSPSTSSATS